MKVSAAAEVERMPVPLRRRFIVRAAALEELANTAGMLTALREGAQPPRNLPAWMARTLVELSRFGPEQHVTLELAEPLPLFAVTVSWTDDLAAVMAATVDGMFPAWQRARKTIPLAEAARLWAAIHGCGLSYYALARRGDFADPDSRARTIRDQVESADLWLSLDDYPLRLTRNIRAANPAGTQHPIRRRNLHTASAAAGRGGEHASPGTYTRTMA